MAAELSPRLLAMVDQMQAGLDEQKGDDFERLKEGLFNAQVCTSLSDDEAAARMNLTPSGTSHGWQLTDEVSQQPVPCADRPATHRHLIFEC